MIDTGNKLAATPVPVPLRLTVCGLLEAVSVKLNEALRLPPADGVNVTLTEHVPCEGTVTSEQVSALLLKSAAFVPLIATAETVRLAPLLLVSVTLCVGLVVPRDWEKAKPNGAKITDPGVKLATRFAAFTVPIPVAKSHPGAAPNAD